MIVKTENVAPSRTDSPSDRNLLPSPERSSSKTGLGRGSNLTEKDRVRGGERSARIQKRDRHGHFAGLREEESRNESPWPGTPGEEAGMARQGRDPFDAEGLEENETTVSAVGSIAEQSASIGSPRR